MLYHIHITYCRRFIEHHDTCQSVCWNVNLVAGKSNRTFVFSNSINIANKRIVSNNDFVILLWPRDIVCSITNPYYLMEPYTPIFISLLFYCSRRLLDNIVFTNHIFYSEVQLTKVLFLINLLNNLFSLRQFYTWAII